MRIEDRLAAVPAGSTHARRSRGTPRPVATPVRLMWMLGADSIICKFSTKRCYAAKQSHGGITGLFFGVEEWNCTSYILSCIAPEKSRIDDTRLRCCSCDATVVRSDPLLAGTALRGTTPQQGLPNRHDARWGDLRFCGRGEPGEICQIAMTHAGEICDNCKVSRCA